KRTLSWLLSEYICMNKNTLHLRPCGGRDCSGGCECFPEKGGRARSSCLSLLGIHSSEVSPGVRCLSHFLQEQHSTHLTPHKMARGGGEKRRWLKGPPL
uniref:Uncharacterized protein n=1 Tax=Chelonoidis abingdonii TaxID=106734 RepID=A0A8C0QR59_CHEAB